MTSAIGYSIKSTKMTNTYMRRIELEKTLSL